MIPESSRQAYPAPPDGVVLVGGKGRRMGSDKTALELGGKTLLEIAVDALRPLVGRVFLAGGDHQYPGCQNLLDVIPDAGPLSGLLTALCASDAERTVVLAVDMPLVRSATLRALIEASPESDITIACSPEGQNHPLCGVYGARCIRPARELLLSGCRRVGGLIQSPELVVRSVSWADLGCPPEEFINVNTPEDLEKARQWIGRFSQR